MPHWTAIIKEKVARAKENNLNIIGGRDFGRKRIKSECLAEG